MIDIPLGFRIVLSQYSRTRKFLYFESNRWFVWPFV